jgi:RNA polymerase sigma-70 factor (ECF subfamily)
MAPKVDRKEAIVNPDATPPDGDHLLAAHYLPVMRLCLSRLRDPADAEDATQEVFRRAVQHGDALRDDPLPWLIAVAKNVCNDELRRRRRHPATVASDSSAMVAPAHTTPEVTVVGRMAAMELLGRLTPGERRAVAARIVNGGEAAPTSTTRVLLSRARHKLRRYIEESQSAFGTATVYSNEALHRLRSRLFGRVLIGSGRAAVVIPAVLAIGIVGGLGGDVASGGAPPRSIVPTFAPPGSLNGGAPGDRGATAADGGALSRVARGIPAPAAPHGAYERLPPTENTLQGWALPQFDYRLVSTRDVQPSPAYASDHTVWMIGPNGNCQLDVCAQMYRSDDGGATWTYIDSRGLHGSQLILPPAAYPSGRFYVYGSGGLQTTGNRGGDFTAVPPIAPLGYAVTPPPSTGLDAVVAVGNMLWGVRHSDGAATLLSLFADGGQAAGFPAVITTRTGYAILEAVNPPVAGTGAPVSMLERCTPACGPPQPMPFEATWPTVLASPDAAVDHAVYVVGWGLDMAVSHDAGLTWTVTGNPHASTMIAVHGPRGRRLIAALGDRGALEYSDDDGRTWRRSEVRVYGLEYARSLAELRPGRLIASMLRTDQLGTWNSFVCSTDGAVWTLCRPDT